MTRARETDTVLGRGRFLELRITPTETGDAHPHGHGWEYVRRPGSRGAVLVLAITRDDELVLVEQMRPAVGATVIELPAGLIGDVSGQGDEAPSLAAERELLEETGFRAARIEALGSGPSSAAFSTEILHFFRAIDLEREGPGGGDETESITVHLVPLASLRRWLDERSREGRLVEPRIYAALALARVAF